MSPVVSLHWGGGAVFLGWVLGLVPQWATAYVSDHPVPYAHGAAASATQRPDLPGWPTLLRGPGVQSQHTNPG